MEAARCDENKAIRIRELGASLQEVLCAGGNVLGRRNEENHRAWMVTCQDRDAAKGSSSRATGLESRPPRLGGIYSFIWLTNPNEILMTTCECG